MKSNSDNGRRCALVLNPPSKIVNCDYICNINKKFYNQFFGEHSNPNKEFYSKYLDSLEDLVTILVKPSFFNLRHIAEPTIPLCPATYILSFLFINTLLFIFY